MVRGICDSSRLEGGASASKSVKPRSAAIVTFHLLVALMFFGMASFDAYYGRTVSAVVQSLTSSHGWSRGIPHAGDSVTPIPRRQVSPYGYSGSRAPRWSSDHGVATGGRPT